MLSSDQHLQSWVKSIEKCKVIFTILHIRTPLQEVQGWERTWAGGHGYGKTGLTRLRWGPPELGDTSGLGYNTPDRFLSKFWHIIFMNVLFLAQIDGYEY